MKEVFFPFHIRIPGWCKQPIVKVNGNVVKVDLGAGAVARVNRTWKNGDVMTVELPMPLTSSSWYGGSRVIERGPLLYALKMNERWTKHDFEPDKQTAYGPWYYEVTSDTPWNYAFRMENLSPSKINETFTVEKRDWTGKYPWNVENAPIVLKAKAHRLKGWTLYRGSTGPIGYYSQLQGELGAEEAIQLIPYGCTTLRLTEFPVR